jgi:hypothetical protein
MELDTVYYELNKQLENIADRLLRVEEKIDAQVEKDHIHELKIQKLEITLENIRLEQQGEKKVINAQFEKVIKDLDSLFTRIWNVEQTPDAKKAKLVNKIIDRSINYLIDAALAGGVAYLTIQLLAK